MAVEIAPRAVGIAQPALKARVARWRGKRATPRGLSTLKCAHVRELI